MKSSKTCEACRRRIGAKEVSFVLRIELFADPTPPTITEKDLKKDLRAEMEALVKKMGKLDPEEAKDEIHERYEYVVCRDCRRHVHRRLKFPFMTKD